MPPAAEHSGAADGKTAAEGCEDKPKDTNPILCESATGQAVNGEAVDGEAVGSKAADGTAADGKPTDGKAAGGKAADGQVGSLLIESDIASGPVLADGTQMLLELDDAVHLAEPATVAVRTGATCANGQAFAMAPRRKRAVDAGAALAQEHFGPAAAGAAAAEAPAGKRRRGAAAFAPAVLAGAPGSLQSCRSLLRFLERKLQAPPAPAPEPDGPSDLRELLAAHAERAGRLAAFGEPAAWDARARRALDVPAAAASGPGAAELAAAGRLAESSEAELAQELKERGEVDVNTLIKERAAWAKECVRREWFDWCACLLRVQEASLLAGGKAPVAPHERGGVGVLDVLKALLANGG